MKRDIQATSLEMILVNAENWRPETPRTKAGSVSIPKQSSGEERMLRNCNFNLLDPALPSEGMSAFKQCLHFILLSYRCYIAIQNPDGSGQ